MPERTGARPNKRLPERCASWVRSGIMLSIMTSAAPGYSRTGLIRQLVRACAANARKMALQSARRAARLRLTGRIPFAYCRSIFTGQIYPISFGGNLPPSRDRQISTARSARAIDEDALYAAVSTPQGARILQARSAAEIAPQLRGIQCRLDDEADLPACSTRPGRCGLNIAQHFAVKRRWVLQCVATDDVGARSSFIA